MRGYRLSHLQNMLDGVDFFSRYTTVAQPVSDFFVSGAAQRHRLIV